MIYNDPIVSPSDNEFKENSGSTIDGQAGAHAADQKSHDAEYKQRCETMQKELDACNQEQQEWKDKYFRLNADFDNFKRRSYKDQQQLIETAQMKLFIDIITIVDDFDRAYEEAKKAAQTPELQTWLDGFMLIRSALIKLLKKYQVEEMGSLTTFDPEHHEAIMQVASAEHKPGDIVTVLQKGYVYKNMVLRPAKVSVAQ